MVKRLLVILFSGLMTFGLLATPAHAKDVVPGSATITGGDIYGDTIYVNVEAKNIVAGTTIILRVETCSGKYTYRKVTGRSGNFHFETKMSLNNLPAHPQVRTVRKHSNYKTYTDIAGLNLEGQAKC